MKDPRIIIRPEGAEFKVWDSRVGASYWPAVVRKDPCAYCGVPRCGTVDHIEPRGRGGENLTTNMTGACVHCNGRKKDQDLLWFLLKRAGWQPVKKPKRKRARAHH